MQFSPDLLTMPAQDALPLGGRVAFFGRTLEDYRALYGLDGATWAAGPVLDVAAGPSSFALEATLEGATVVAVDPLYRYRLPALRDRVAQDYAEVRAYVEERAGQFRDGGSDPAVWARRRRAAERFLEDFGPGCAAGRYRPGSLPALPFADGQFATALCGHFLFLYAGSYSFDFHLAALRELARVAREQVLVYPLVDLEGRRYALLEPLREALRADGIETALEALEAPMLRGADERLRLHPARRAPIA